MSGSTSTLVIRLAQSDQDLRAAQRLRYAVFVSELGGGGGAMVDHAARREVDPFDAHCDHLLLIDTARDPEEGNHVVGVYRLLNCDRAAVLGRYYCEAEYDLDLLKNSGRRLLELGRSCVHADYRGGLAIHLLWQALSDYIVDNKIEILFGVASFHGTDIAKIAPLLSFLKHKYQAPADLCVPALAAHYQDMALVDPADIDRVAVMVEMPSLIKAYLRLGGLVGDGAYIDHAFNTTDICLIMDTATMNLSAAKTYARRAHG